MFHMFKQVLLAAVCSYQPLQNVQREGKARGAAGGWRGVSFIFCVLCSFIGFLYVPLLVLSSKACSLRQSEDSKKM